jgi:glyoxylase-like metal-dependent hydrolase (beta-lactamase superfamily II)
MLAAPFLSHADAKENQNVEGPRPMATPPTQQIPGVYHRKIGDIVVTAISDGYIDGTLDLLRNVDLDKARGVLRSAFRPVRRISVNGFLIHSKGRTALVDTGAGNNFGATAGWLKRNVTAAGIDFGNIDTVLLTHMHADHSAGLTNLATGERIFSNAELVMHENEYRHWLDDAMMAKASEHDRKVMFQASRTQIGPYRDRTRLFASGEVFPGVTAVPIPGHTPGHTGYLIASGSDQLLIWGDVVHLPEVQVAFPETGTGFDTDIGQATVSRKRIFDQVATDGVLIAGMHMHFPGFSHLTRQGEGYQIYPEAWVHALS